MEPSKAKKKQKAIGGFSEEDPFRTLAMRESIYSLAFAVNLKNKKMEELKVRDECRPNSLLKSEVNLTALLCGFCQIFTSWLLL